MSDLVARRGSRKHKNKTVLQHLEFIWTRLPQTKVYLDHIIHDLPIVTNHFL